MIVLLLIGALIVFAEGSVIAPFIYAIFELLSLQGSHESDAARRYLGLGTANPYTAPTSRNVWTLPREC